MIIVSDTTAITSLIKINRADLLRELFGEVFIPAAVRDELLKYHRTIPAFFQVRSIADNDSVILLRADLDSGEAEAIILAEELTADALLIDEKQGRAIAEARGIQCIGLAGALILAKQKGLIASVADLLSLLETHGNFYLDPYTKRLVLTRVNEMI